jgi:hypothetical protein
LRRFAIFVLFFVSLGFVIALPLILLVQPSIEPDVHALDCFSRARQGQLLDPRERWTPEEALQQWRSEQDRGTVDLGCWAVKPYRCDEGCQ